jgi:hypothetical protein
VTGVPFLEHTVFTLLASVFLFSFLFRMQGGPFLQTKNLDSICHQGKKLFDFLFEGVELGSTEKLAQSDF